MMLVRANKEPLFSVSDLRKRLLKQRLIYAPSERELGWSKDNDFVPWRNRPQ